MCDHTKDIQRIYDAISDINRSMQGISKDAHEAMATAKSTHDLTARLIVQYDEHIRVNDADHDAMWQKINDLLGTKNKLVGIVTVIGAIVATTNGALQDAVSRMWHTIFR